MLSFVEGLVWFACCSSLSPGFTPATPASPMRTFLVDKMPEANPDRTRVTRGPASATPSIPDGRGTLRASVGVGYVQGADWGVEAVASGSVAGLDVQLDSLVTYG